MKSIALLVVAALLALAAPFQLSSCVSQRTDELALFEPLRVAWPDVRFDLEAGFADGVADGELLPAGLDDLRADVDRLGAALEASDRAELRAAPWLELRPWAVRGVESRLQAGEIGPGVAQSAHEHLSNFDAAVQRLRGAAQ